MSRGKANEVEGLTKNRGVQIQWEMSQKDLEKPLDKCPTMWYNKGVNEEWLSPAG